MSDSLGERIKRARLGALLSRTNLGGKLRDTPPEVVKQWEDGEVVPGTAVLQKIAQATGVRLEDFVPGKHFTLEETEFHAGGRQNA